MRRTVLPVLVIVAALVGPSVLDRLPASVAQVATPAGTECPATTADENKALVSQLYEAISANDEAAMAALMAAEVEYSTPAKGTRTGSPEEFFAGQRANFPEAAVTIDHLMAEGDMVAAYTSWTGAFQGDTAVFFGNELDIPEDGLTSDWVSAVFFRIECGKVGEVWPVADRHRQLRDLGVITEEELRSVDAQRRPNRSGEAEPAVELAAATDPTVVGTPHGSATRSRVRPAPTSWRWSSSSPASFGSDVADTP